MNLKLVTWRIGYDKFLVEADTDEEAIDKATKTNSSNPPADGDCEEEIKDRYFYKVADVDFKMLTNLFMKEDPSWYDDNGILFD